MNTNKIITILKQNKIDAWLIYQNQGTYEVGQNPIATDVCELKELVTRPWFCLIQANSKHPIWIYQSMEKDKFENLKGRKLVYGSRDSLINILKLSLPKNGTIALEITKNANIPLLSRVDQGTYELIRKCTNAKLVSSQDLVGQYLSDWGAQGLASHKSAILKLKKILRGVEIIVKNKLGIITDYELQMIIESLYAKYRLITLYHPVVASGKNSGNPHYFPNKEKPVVIKRNELVMIDIWGKEKTKKSVFADMTTMYYTGPNVPKEVLSAWNLLICSRNSALKYIQKNIKYKIITGAEADNVSRRVL